MKAKFLNILLFSFILTTIGFLADGDRIEPSKMMRFTEYLAMASIVFILTSIVYFPSSFALAKIRKN